jgi:type VI secretion system secreted protein VgrG
LTAATKVTADKAINVSSTQAMVLVTAPKHVLLTAAGAAIRIEGGNITLTAPGKVEFKASMKELAGGGSASASIRLPVPEELPVTPKERFSHTPRLDPSALLAGLKVSEVLAYTFSADGPLLHKSGFSDSLEAETYFADESENVVCLVTKKSGDWILVSADRPGASAPPDGVSFIDLG